MQQGLDYRANRAKIKALCGEVFGGTAAVFGSDKKVVVAVCGFDARGHGFQLPFGVTYATYLSGDYDAYGRYEHARDQSQFSGSVDG